MSKFDFTPFKGAQDAAPKMSASEMRDEINRLRKEAGKPETNKLFGTSLQALQLILNRAQRGEFSD